MRLANGKIVFEDGDKINIKNDISGSGAALIAVKGRICGRCEFHNVCDRKNEANLIAKFCADTHFEWRET